MHQIKITIFGRVQGVNLRRRMVKIASDLNLAGYVSSEEDGSLTIIAQGKEAKLEELLAWCQKGLFPAKITGMNFEWQLPSKKYKRFKLKTDKSLLADEASSLLNLSKEILTQEILKLDSEQQIPKHVVIIPDGNRRWAKERHWLPWVGHKKAVQFERLEMLLQECKNIGVKYLSFWAFSTENWKRDKKETEKLFDLFRDSYPKWLETFHQEKIRFKHIGRRDRLPQDIVAMLDRLTEETKHFSKLNFQLCLDYNGRDDIVRAINKILQDHVGKIDEQSFMNYLDTHGLPEPDLIIRTSGEIRTSGIMAYESAYSELYFTNVYFPDFDSIHFKRAILDFAARKRNFGGSQKNLSAELYDPDEQANFLNLHVKH